MSNGEQYVQLLRETSKLIPLVGLGVCSKIYKFCMEQDLMEPMNPIDFMLFLNIREMASPVIVKNMKKAKVCYIIYRLSQKELTPMLKEQWISAILYTCGIDRIYYDTHYRSLETGKDYKIRKNEARSSVEKFVEGLDNIL